MGPGKQTYSSPFILEFDKVNGDQVQGGEAYVVSSSGREYGVLKLSAGSGAAVVSLYDAKNLASVNPNNKKWVLDAGTGTPDYNVFPNPLAFKNGLVAILEQGSGTNPILNVSVIGDLPS